MMKKRKLIALITTNPESVYQQRVMEGVFAQCNKYGYDVAVFSTLVHISHYYKDYLNGELNIYNLLNYDLVDGVIVTSISLSNNKTAPVFDEILERLDKECRKKVISFDLPMGDYETVYTNDREAFKEITEHIYDVHKCKNVYFLTGVKNYKVSEMRLGGYLDFCSERGIEVDENKIFYGDFWYGSGEKLADDIYFGNVEMPDAVICASDHMAIGLVNRLIEHGIKVPEQIIVTGYDATQEAVINDISITSFEPYVSKAAAEAVNRIHEIIEPDVPTAEIGKFSGGGIKIGESCGCTPDVQYIKQKLNSSLYLVHHNLVNPDEYNAYDISRLLESYMYEQLVSTDTALDCLNGIYQCTYLINPYEDFYLCLKDNWLDMSDVCKKGYPDNMNIFIYADSKVDKKIPGVKCYSRQIDNRYFDTKQMLPQMHEYYDKPSVYYFSPVHFSDETLGYSVLRCKLTQQHKINYVYRNWIRYVNNALEMTRIRTQLLINSVLDMATGLYNRRGLYIKINEMCKSAEGKTMMVIMADMDKLKYINDTFGHSEGDYGLQMIADSLKCNADKHEICVRNGGDEFLLIGIGNYTDSDADKKISGITHTLIEKSRISRKPYEVTASMGFCLSVINEDTNVDLLIGIADEKMYQEKKKNHMNRF